MIRVKYNILLSELDSDGIDLFENKVSVFVVVYRTLLCVLSIFLLRVYGGWRLARLENVHGHSSATYATRQTRRRRGIINRVPFHPGRLLWRLGRPEHAREVALSSGSFAHDDVTCTCEVRGNFENGKSTNAAGLLRSAFYFPSERRSYTSSACRTNDRCTSLYVYAEPKRETREYLRFKRVTRKTLRYKASARPPVAVLTWANHFNGRYVRSTNSGTRISILVSKLRFRGLRRANAFRYYSAARPDR